MSRSSLTPGNGLSAAALGSSVGFGSLSTNRKAATVSQTPEGLNIRKSADVQLGLSSKVTFDQEASPLDSASDASQIFIREITYAC
jgi:hypothetical protein